MPQNIATVIVAIETKHGNSNEKSSQFWYYVLVLLMFPWYNDINVPVTRFQLILMRPRFWLILMRLHIYRKLGGWLGHENFQGKIWFLLYDPWIGYSKGKVPLRARSYGYWKGKLWRRCMVWFLRRGWVRKEGVSWMLYFYSVYFDSLIWLVWCLSV